MRGATWLALLLLPASALAQSPEPDTAVVPLPEVVVRALRGEDRLRQIPAAAFVIPREALVRSAAPRLSSLLQWLPGLNAYQSGATGEPSVVDPRGFTANGESSYLKVLVNGRDTRDLENGNVDWDWIGPESIDRVEVVEGPGGWLYGDGAEGGIVNIVRDEPRLGFAPRGTLRFGSFEQRGGSLGTRWGAGPWSASLGGGGREVDGWRDNSREWVRSAHTLASWRSGDGRTTASLDGSWLKTRREDPGALTPDQLVAPPNDPQAENRTQAENPGDYLASHRGSASLEVRRGDPLHGEWTAAAHGRLEDFRQVRTLVFQPLYHPSSGSTWGAHLGWRAVPSIAGWPIRIAARYEVERSNLITRYYDPSGPGPGTLVAHANAWRTTQSGTVSAAFDPLPPLTARAGVRFDAIRLVSHEQISGGGDRRSLSAPSPFLALSARSGPGTAWVSVSGGFHAPTLNQLYDQRPFPTGAPPPFPPFITISNPDLEPQRAVDYEVGGRWDAPSGAAASLTFYEIFVRDEIDFDLGTFSYANIGKSRHAGFLAAARAPLGRGVALTVTGALAPTTISGGQLDGNQINAVPIGSAAGRLEWTPRDWASLEAGARWVARQYLDKENEHPLADFGTIELGGVLRRGPARLSVRVANLLDREYADTGFIGALGEERLVPAAGRQVTVALGVE
jgi:vitamin B12 transporter